MSLGEELKSETPWALCLTKEATPLAPKRQLISYINPQTRIAWYLPSVGTRMNPWWVSVTSSKSEERGWREYLQGGSSNQDSYLKVEACSQEQGWTQGQILTLWDGFEVHLLVNTPPLQVVHTHTRGCHPQPLGLYHPEETPGEVTCPHIEGEEDSGSAHDLLGLASHCHRGLVLEGSALSLNWLTSKDFF